MRRDEGLAIRTLVETIYRPYDRPVVVAYGGNVKDGPNKRSVSSLDASPRDAALGDGEFLGRLRERTTGAVIRPAGSTLLLDANIPPQRLPSP